MENSSILEGITYDEYDATLKKKDCSLLSLSCSYKELLASWMKTIGTESELVLFFEPCGWYLVFHRPNSLVENDDLEAMKKASKKFLLEEASKCNVTVQDLKNNPYTSAFLQTNRSDILVEDPKTVTTEDVLKRIEVSHTEYWNWNKIYDYVTSEELEAYKEMFSEWLACKNFHHYQITFFNKKSEKGLTFRLFMFTSEVVIPGKKSLSVFVTALNSFLQTRFNLVFDGVTLNNRKKGTIAYEASVLSK